MDFRQMPDCLVQLVFAVERLQLTRQKKICGVKVNNCLIVKEKMEGEGVERRKIRHIGPPSLTNLQYVVV